VKILRTSWKYRRLARRSEWNKGASRVIRLDGQLYCECVFRGQEKMEWRIRNPKAARNTIDALNIGLVNGVRIRPV